jgi:hypothetical protein
VVSSTPRSLYPRKIAAAHFTGRSEGVYALNLRPSSPVVLVGKVNRNASCVCMFVQVNVVLHVISELRRSGQDIFVLLGCYAAQIGG